MALAYFGAQGAYSLSDSVDALRYAAQGTATTSNTSGLGMLGSAIGGTLAYQNYGQMMNNLQNQYAQNQMTSTNIYAYRDGTVGCSPEPPKAKPKGILARLRDEIEGWHGDVLGRYATA